MLSFRVGTARIIATTNRRVPTTTYYNNVEQQSQHTNIILLYTATAYQTSCSGDYDIVANKDLLVSRGSRAVSRIVRPYIL